MDPSLRTLIEQAEFKESFRGYDRAQVDDTLEQLASRAGKLESDLAEAANRLADAETRIRAEAQAEIEARGTANGVAAPARNEEQDAEEVRLTLVMAQRTADAAMAEARVKAEEILDAARTEAMRTTADARSESTRERQEGRKRVESEVKELEAVRTVLQGDIDVMERHVKSERGQLLGAIERLRALLDDPEAFRTSPPPTPTPVTIPEAPPELTDSPAPGEPEQPGSSEAAQVAPAEGAAAATPAGQATPSAGDSPKTDVNLTAPVDHLEPGVADAGAKASATGGSAGGAASGPSVDTAHEEDAFLSELRKAMSDDEPGAASASQSTGTGPEASKLRAGVQDASASERDKQRFGRRR